MKKTIKQLIEEYIKEGFTLTQAKNIIATVYRKIKILNYY